MTNASGATNITGSSATLNGNLVSDGSDNTTTVTVYYGPGDGDTVAANWQSNVPLGTIPVGLFSTSVSSLVPGTRYYYRCRASNGSGAVWAPATSSFIAAPTAIRLLGPTDAATGTCDNNTIFWDKWTAETTGTINQMRVKCNYGGNLKLALYADNAGSPGTLLNAVNTSTPVAAGWNSISIPATTITNGASYWLAFISDNSTVTYQTSTGAPRKFKAATYSSFSFASSPTGLTDSAGSYSGLAGWWTPPSTATVTNAGGADNITASSATLNGNLIEDGGSSTSITIYWGPTDGGSNPGSWLHNVSLGTKPVGTFSTYISNNIAQGTTYYYRCCATNSAGTAWATSSSSFVAQNSARLLGPTDATTGIDLGGYALWDQWAASATGSVTHLRIKCNSAGNIKAAIYADNGGNPGNLLQAVNSSTPVVAGWNTVAVPSTPVTSGTSYWLAVISDTACIAYQTAGGTPRQYLATTYSTFSFSSNPTGLSNGTGYYDGIAAWGVTAAPTVTNHIGATNCSGTAATLNGNLIHDGGATCNVTIYWGPVDGGSVASNWANNVPLGTRSIGTFSIGISGLTPGGTYYYRCCATNWAGAGWSASSSSFTANSVPLIGADTADNTTLGNVANYLTMGRFTAAQSGSMQQIKLYGVSAGNVKVAIYSDSGGQPSNLLNPINTSTPISAGWNTITFPSTTLVGGVSYWLAFISDNNSAGIKAGGGQRRYQAATFSTFTFPASAGSGYSSDTYSCLLAGWGLPTGATAPALNNANGATDATGTTATLNGNLISDGGASCNVTIYWGATDGGMTPGSWTDNVSLGTRPAGAFSTDIAGLTQATQYYYRCYAVNSAGPAWAASTSSFISQAAPPTSPTITNAGGATNTTGATATLNGNLTSTGGASCNVTVYWGAADGGTTPGNWQHPVPLGAKTAGPVSENISGLSEGSTYYYRFYAVNQYGDSWSDSSAAFVARNQSLIIGAVDATSGTNGGGYAVWTQWPALYSGSVNQIKVKCTAPANLKVALYADSAGSPGALLQAVNTPAPAVTGWNTIAITPAPVISGSKYWLAFISDNSSVAYRTQAGTTRLYKAATFSSHTFTSNPAGLTSATGYYDGVAGWGIGGATAPSVTNANGATNITGTAARLTGYLLSDGNATTTVMVYWGDNDGGTVSSSWDNSVSLGVRTAGAFATDNCTGLTQGNTYYYRTCATNSAGTAWAAATHSFVAAPSVKIIGADPSDVPNISNTINQLFMTRFVPTLSGNITEFRVRCSSAGAIKVALYSDSSGQPDARLAMSNSSMPVIAGWNIIGIPSTEVTAGTGYWLAYCSSASIGARSGTGARRYKAADFETFYFPSTAGTGFTADTTAYDLVAGWGIVPGATSPTITNGNGAACAGTTATLHGNLVSVGSDNTTTVIVYWGPTDGGNVPAGWAHSVNLGLRYIGPFSTNITGLTAGTTYYYRCAASNSAGTVWAPGAAAFVAENATWLLGALDATSGTCGYGSAVWNKWAAAYSGNINQVRIKSTATANVKVAIYTDSNSQPGNLLVSDNISKRVVPGWNNISIAPTPVVSGTNYWLAWISDSNCVAYQGIPGAPRRYQAATYSTFNFPPVVGTMSDGSGYYDGIAGWGTTTITPPSVTNACGASFITGTSATLNGNLVSNGSDNTTAVTVYWGQTDGGTSKDSWTDNVTLGVVATGVFNSPLTNLTAGATYYYRCYASNSGGSAWAADSASFTAVPAPTQLIGATDANTGTAAALYVVYQRWQATTSGNASQIRLKCNGSGNVKAAIYADNGTVLTGNYSSVVAGWNTVSVASTALAAGSYYWLAFASDASTVAYEQGKLMSRYVVTYLGSQENYNAFTFSSLPGGATDSLYHWAISAWGVPSAQGAPVVTNSTGADNITATSAVLRGNLTTDGNFDTEVTLYWGPTNGENVTGNWANSIPLGTRLPGDFSASISGLAHGATYYYRCYAVNAAGSAWAASSASFIATQPSKIIGAEADSPSSGAQAAGYLILSKWAAASTTSISQIRVKANAVGNVKVAIYADSGGNPGALLRAVNTGSAVVSGWNSINITPVPVTAGTTYWLAYNSNQNVVLYNTGASNQQRYKTQAYAGDFPDPAGSGFTSAAYYNLMAGWGATSVVEPIVTASAGATNITPSGATLNGALTNDGGASCNVTLYWGTVNGDNITANWQNSLSKGIQPAGALADNITGLTEGVTYYYRYFATNLAGAAWSPTASFFAHAPVRLVGASSSGSGTLGTNTVSFDRWTASAGGKVTQMRVHSAGSGYIKLAIYSDNNSLPYLRLASDNLSIPVSAGWNTISISPTEVVSGASYWLAAIRDSSNLITYLAGSSPYRYTTATYSTYTFPEIMGSTSAGSNNYSCIAGWGGLTLTVPSVDNGSGATDVSGSSATLNGNLTFNGYAADNATVSIYWGAADGGTAAENWTRSASLGMRPLGAFSAAADNLTQSETYYYRCRATNAVGSAWSPSTYSFVAQNMQRLLGDNTTGSANAPAGYVVFDRFQCTQSGVLKTLNVYSGAGGNIKLAVYSDNNSQPCQRLACNAMAVIRPGGADTTALAAQPSGSNYSRVDEEAENKADYVYIYSPSEGTPYTGYTFYPATARDIYAMGDHGSENGTITNVTVYARCAKVTYAAGTFNARLGLKLGVDLAESSDQAITTEYTASNWQLMSYSMASRPGGGPWSWADIDNLKASVYLYVFGGLSQYIPEPGIYVATPNQAACDQVWVKVTYYETAGVVPGAPTVPEQSPVTGGQWNAVSLADNVSMTQGNYYWIAYIGDAAGVARNLAAGSGTRRYKAETFGPYSFPLTYDGTGFASDNLSDTLSGFGLLGSPVILTNPPNFSVSGMPGRSIEQTMIVSNGGSGSLDWSATKTAGWLNLSAESGTSGLSVTVSENLTGLNPGTYTDNITITAAGAINSPLVVPVTLTVTSGGGSTFVYDGDGRRVKKTENGQTTIYVNKYFESNLTASENTTYYYLGGRLTAMRRGEGLRYVHQDHLTGTSLVTDSSGNQVGTTMKYYPFGGTRSGSVPTDIRFTGQRLDDSGLYYFNARYYDPQIGRFISGDTIVPGAFNSQAFNRYAYVMNNPLKYNDPSGHSNTEPDPPPPEPPPPPIDPLKDYDCNGLTLPGWSILIGGGMGGMGFVTNMGAQSRALPSDVLQALGLPSTNDTWCPRLEKVGNYGPGVKCLNILMYDKSVQAVFFVSRSSDFGKNTGFMKGNNAYAVLPGSTESSNYFLGIYVWDDLGPGLTNHELIHEHEHQVQRAGEGPAYFTNLREEVNRCEALCTSKCTTTAEFINCCFINNIYQTKADDVANTLWSVWSWEDNIIPDR